MSEKKNKIHTLLFWIGIAALYLLQFLTHRRIPFMMDDEWYSTNLATGDMLNSLQDVVEGQVWHYRNWGGRSITHGILQLTLMSGELCADILNVIMTILLAYMICVVSGQKSRCCFLLSSTMLVALNANAKMSMFWQSGLVNYVYSTVWILVFLWLYFRMVRNNDSALAENKWGNILLIAGIVLLGLITGWSNENMGPTCFVLAVLTIIYRVRIGKKDAPLWMYLGAASALAGSLLVILAPGNFVRGQAIEEKTLVQKIYERFFSMYEAGIEFLFPTVMFLVLLLILYVGVLGRKLKIEQILLVVGMILSYGAMVLSPHYPDRATFGTMVLGIAVIISIWGKITSEINVVADGVKLQKYSYILQASMWIYSLSVLLEIGIEFVG